MTASPLDRARVAQLVVTRGGERSRGSGYRVRADAVLTAAHVVDGADSVRIRFGPGLDDEWTVETTSWWMDRVSDVAVVTFAPREADSVVPAQFGRIDDRAARLNVVAVGFPLWNLDATAGGKPYRDSVQADGTVPVLSNWRGGKLAVVVEPPAAREDDLSPWEGMSGSAVWVKDRIVGVIATHHVAGGLGRLAAARVDKALDHVDPVHGTALRDVLDLHEPLADVLPASRSARVHDTRQAMVRNAAPERLRDRDWELEELVEFCAGDEKYLWWQAGPWAGKSALLGWFALHPPDGVDVVSFFINGRQAGESDSDAFTEAMIDQLAALADESPKPALKARARRLHTYRLLDTAAARCAEAGRLLLLVVDGLDEDTSRDDGLNRPSIASLLPRRPAPNVRVLVASRPHPDLPDDVPGDHPLRTIPPRQLPVSLHAKNIEVVAKEELRALLAKPGLQRDILGLITASGGGLTQSDLEELLALPPFEWQGLFGFELEVLFGGVLGRSVGARASRGQAEPVYLFTHDTLREQAELKFGKGIAARRAALHDWADGYRARGWPENTPRYLFRGYVRMLAARGEVDRLVACALDRVRHDRMLAVTGGDGAALTEIVSAAGLLAKAPVPDLLMLLRVAAARSALGDRNGKIPAELPGVWARLGRRDRAIALADSFVSDGRRARALIGLIAAIVECGGDERLPRLARDAERAAKREAHPRLRNEMLVALAEALAGSDEDERSRRIVAELESSLPKISEVHARDDLLSRLARLAATRGDHESALAHLVAISGPHRQADTCSALPPMDGDLTLRYLMAIQQPHYLRRWAVSLAHAAQADPEQALRFLRAAWDDEADLDRSLRPLAIEAVGAGDDDRALRYVLAAKKPDELLDELVERLVKLDEVDRAARLTEAISTPRVRVNASISLALAYARTGDVERKAKLLATAEAAVTEIERLDERAGAVARLAMAVRVLGDDRYAQLADLAESTAEQAARFMHRPDLLCVLARCAIEAGDLARARRLLEAVRREVGTDLRFAPWKSIGALIRLAVAAGADDLLPGLLAPLPQVADLHRLLEAALAEGDNAQVRRIAEAAAGCVDSHEPFSQVLALAELGEDDLVFGLTGDTDAWLWKNDQIAKAAKVVAKQGEDDRAQRYIGALTTSHHRKQACNAIAGTLVEAREFDRVAGYLAQIDDIYGLDLAWRTVAEQAKGLGEHDRALGFLDQVTEPSVRAVGLVSLAAAVGASGEIDRAVNLCVTAEDLVRNGMSAEIPLKSRLDLARALLSAGDEDRSSRLVRTITEPVPLIRGLCDLAVIALDNGDGVQARALAEEAAEVDCEDPNWHLRRLVDVLVRTGAVESAQRAVSDFETFVTACTDDLRRSMFVNSLVETMAIVGRYTDAVTYIDEMPAERDGDRAWVALAEYAPAGPILDQARSRISAFVMAVEQKKTRYLPNWVVTGLNKLGELDRVFDLLSADQAPEFQSQAVRTVVESAPQEPERRRYLFTRLEDVIAEVPDVLHRDRMFVVLADQRDKDGDHGEAVRLAGLVVDPSRREKLLRDIRLQAVAAGRETLGARQFVAEVLASGDWQLALEAAGKVDLQALQQFADEVLG